MQSPNCFYYTWRLLFLHHSFAWCVFILLKRSFSPGRTGGFHQLLDNKSGKSHQRFTALSVGYRKDVFMFFVDKVELSEFLMKSFALLTMKSKPTVLMKFSATQKMKLNPPIAAAISYAESVFHIAKQYFTHPQGWI